MNEMTIVEVSKLLRGKRIALIPFGDVERVPEIMRETIDYLGMPDVVLMTNSAASELDGVWFGCVEDCKICSLGILGGSAEAELRIFNVSCVFGDPEQRCIVATVGAPPMMFVDKFLIPNKIAVDAVVIQDGGSTEMEHSVCAVNALVPKWIISGKEGVKNLRNGEFFHSDNWPSVRPYCDLALKLDGVRKHKEDLNRYKVTRLSTAECLVKTLTEKHLTCATAESCTGGGIGNAITDVSGASAVFYGGVISYDNSVKQHVLGVDADILNGVGPVSAECAEQMAQGAQKMLNTDLAVSVTGLAGPGGDGAHPAGYVWFGLATREGVRTENVTFNGNRAQVRAAAVEHALGMLLEEAKILDSGRYR